MKRIAFYNDHVLVRNCSDLRYDQCFWICVQIKENPQCPDYIKDMSNKRIINKICYTALEHKLGISKNSNCFIIKNEKWTTRIKYAIFAQIYKCWF